QLLKTTMELRLEDGVSAVGLVTKAVANLISEYNAMVEEGGDSPTFIFNDGFIKFHPELDTEPKRTAAVKAMVDHWRERDSLECLRGWRNEIYPVYYTKRVFNDTLAFTLERSASWAFGVATFGVHVNGYTRDEVKGELQLWVARRAQTKPTWPNYLDNMVSLNLKGERDEQGELRHGDGIFKTMIKECQEEGSIPRELAERAQPVGAVTYTSLTHLGVSPETQYVYDLELPASFRPTPNDGEVEAYHLMKVEEVLTKLREGKFKPNCGLVTIDFLIRHGQLTAEMEPNLAHIQARCHRPSPFYPL
ncbi:hypothetical protein L0F63_004872, partial [Massospora cicadina]